MTPQPEGVGANVGVTAFGPTGQPRDARRVVLLGSTGSIGTQTLEVVRAFPDRFRVVGLAAGSDAQQLAEQAREFGVRELALADPAGARHLRALAPGARVRDGLQGVAELAGLPDADVVLNAVVGSQGLLPTLAALEAGHLLALANKESLIVGGPLVLAAAGNRLAGASPAAHVPPGEPTGGGHPADVPGDLLDVVIPVDSEHSALAQCLRAGDRADVARLLLTASGGPFRGRSRGELAEVTPGQALQHPTWAMGPVITINSATLMNKGLELIEAHLLFGVDYDRLDVLVHPQSLVHSMVEFADGSTIAQLSPPDMRLPIQLALGWPRRLPKNFSAMDWRAARQLDFEPVDRTTFRALDLCIEAGRRGGTYPAVLNAANEQAVAGFLDGRIGFLDIVEVVEAVLGAHEPPGTRPGLEEVLQTERWARARADALLASADPTAPARGDRPRLGAAPGRDPRTTAGRAPRATTLGGTEGGHAR